VRLLVEEVGLSPQRMTVSTSGIVPGIERFAQEPAEVRPKLAISLNAPNDEIRSQIMPINRKWPIAAVMEAVRGLRLRSRERVTFEYVLLGGVTDRPEHAAEVARLLRRTGLPVKVNLIAWNPGPGINYATPQPEAVEAFRRTLTDAGIPTYLRTRYLCRLRAVEADSRRVRLRHLKIEMRGARQPSARCLLLTACYCSQEGYYGLSENRRTICCLSLVLDGRN
jgi:adenine C2-methylase RlmN of 23S rRNA A2503 and tRNA A37